MTTWKEKMAQDTARYQHLPNFIGSLPGGTCARFFDRPQTERICTLPNGHEGECSDEVEADLLKNVRVSEAGFSVDAGNPRPEQPAPDRLGGQPPAEPKEGQ